MFIMVDEKSLVVDAATHQDSLSEHNVQNKALTLIELPGNSIVFVGDEYDPLNKQIIKRPENYPQPTTDDLAEVQIQAEMRRLAVASLKAKGTLPENYVDKKDVAEEAIAIDDQVSEVNR